MYSVLVKFGNNPYVTIVLRRYVFDEQPTVQDVLNRVANDVKSQVPWVDAEVFLCGAKLMATADTVPDRGVLTICL